MPRPRITRRIFFEPNVNYFKPVGVPFRHLDEVILNREEIEAIRLIDHDEVNQGKACKKMKISQPTLSRLLKSARKKISEALIHGNAIKIQGGNFEMVQPRRGLGQGFGRGQRRGRMGGFAAGPGGNCVCPNCGYKEAQIRGQSCMSKKCPKCGNNMTRE